MALRWDQQTLFHAFRELSPCYVATLHLTVLLVLFVLLSSIALSLSLSPPPFSALLLQQVGCGAVLGVLFGIFFPVPEPSLLVSA